MAEFLRDEYSGENILIMDDAEAGYLKDLLTAHVSGLLTVRDAPLARVRKALAPVSRFVARRSPEYGNGGYAVIEEYDRLADMVYAKKLIADDIGWDEMEGRTPEQLR